MCENWQALGEILAAMGIGVARPDCAERLGSQAPSVTGRTRIAARAARHLRLAPEPNGTAAEHGGGPHSTATAHTDPFAQDGGAIENGKEAEAEAPASLSQFGEDDGQKNVINMLSFPIHQPATGRRGYRITRKR